MKRSLALAVCGFSLVLALVGGWLADRQFTAALDYRRPIRLYCSTSAICSAMPTPCRKSRPTTRPT